MTEFVGISTKACTAAADALRRAGQFEVAEALYALENDTDCIIMGYTPPDFDVRQAYKEGWTLSRRSSHPAYAIETLDDPESVGSAAPGFDNDEAAWAHVLTRALAGSQYHRDALIYRARWSPTAFEWVLGARPKVRVPALRALPA